MLSGCFEVTNWEVLTEQYGEGIERLTHCITGYINFCVDKVVSARTATVSRTIKPWITRNIKALLNEIKRAFTEDMEEFKHIQRELRGKIKEGMDIYIFNLKDGAMDGSLSVVLSGTFSVFAYLFSFQLSLSDYIH